MRVLEAQDIATLTSLDVSAASPLTTERPIEYPTLAVALAVHVGFFLLTWYFRHIPLPVAVPLGSVLLAWYSSLQHETIHGHPTAWRRFNSMLAGLPLALWIPYAVYRETHLQHHRHGGRHLTETGHDPETFYLPRGAYASLGRVQRAIRFANCTLAGRLVLGPAVATCTFWATEIRRLRAGDRRHLLIWLRHALGVAAVLTWIVGVCRIPLAVYAALMVYPSISLSHLRSFAEHRGDPDSRLRTRAVESHAFWALIFLNNNLHIAHHAHPKLPWYELPRAWRRMRRSARDAGLVFESGYREVMRKYLFRPFIAVEHSASDGGAE
jgi:fatty acid desaturase